MARFFAERSRTTGMCPGSSSGSSRRLRMSALLAVTVARSLRSMIAAIAGNIVLYCVKIGWMSAHFGAAGAVKPLKTRTATALWRAGDDDAAPRRPVAAEAEDRRSIGPRGVPGSDAWMLTVALPAASVVTDAGSVTPGSPPFSVAAISS